MCIPFRLPRAAVLPDFGQGGIAGLARDLYRYVHDQDDFSSAYLLPAAIDRPLVFVLVDGLGDEFLQRHGQGSTILRHRQRRLTSVLPSTTASAVTTLLTGMPPSIHGLSGWFVEDRRFAGLIAPLPLCRRGKGALRGPQLTERLFPYVGMFANGRRSASLIYPRDIAFSAFSRRHGRGARLLDYSRPDKFVQTIISAVNAGIDAAPFYVHAYYPRFDAVCHHYGANSAQAIAEFWRVDRYFSNLLDALSGSGATVLLTADHGFIDACERRHVRTSQLPGFSSMLAAPLFGERRLAFCRVKKHAHTDFECYVSEQLRGRAVVLRSEALIHAGLMGPGPFHRRLAERCGSHALLMEPGWTISDRLPLERPHRMIGVHGGLSADEMWVPLVLVTP